MRAMFEDSLLWNDSLGSRALLRILVIAIVLPALTAEVWAQRCADGTFGECHAEGKTKEQAKSYPNALLLYVRGCENGEQASCEAAADLATQRPGLRRNRVARRTLKAACERDVGPACTLHGVLMQSRRKLDRQKARRDFEKGCELGDGAGCRRVGELVEATELAVAQELYEKGCKQDDEKSCGNSGRLLAATDVAGALPLLSRGCEASNARACAALGQLHQLGGFPGADTKQAEDAYKKACGGGDALSCGELGSILMRRGDAEGAAPKLLLACKAKLAPKCTELGELYTAQSDARAARRFFGKARVANQRSCRQGNGAACLRVSQDYRLGRGVRTNSAQAERWLERACKAGIGGEKGCLRIGLAAATPRGVRRAEPILRPLCQAGEVLACSALAPIVALKMREPLYRRACELGDRNACVQLPGGESTDALVAAARARETSPASQQDNSQSSSGTANISGAASTSENAGASSTSEDSASVSPEVASVVAAETAQRQAETRARQAAMSAQHAEEARKQAEVRQRTAEKNEAAARRRETQALARAAQAAAKEAAQRKRAEEALARESAAHQEAMQASERESIALGKAKAAGIREAEARKRAREGEASAQEEAKQAALRESKAKRLALLAAAKEAKSKKQAKQAALKETRIRARAEKALAGLAASKKNADESAARESAALAQAQASALKAREALKIAANQKAARLQAEQREREQRSRAERLAKAKVDAEAREAEHRARAEEAAAREAEQKRLVVAREAARKKAALAAKQEAAARKQAEERAEQARKLAKAAAELEAEARRQSEEAAAARATAVAAAAKEASLRRRAQAREAEQRRRAEQAEAKERAAREQAAAREARARKAAEAAAVREAEARKRAKAAAEREAEARKQAEARDAEEKRKAERIAAREAAARKAAEKAAAREAAARKAAEKAAAREAAARKAAEEREALQRHRAETLAAEAAAAREKAKAREEKLLQAIKDAKIREAEAKRKREAKAKAQRAAAAKRIEAQREEARQQAASKRAEAKRAEAERARIAQEKREAAALKAKLERAKRNASKAEVVDIERLDFACEAEHFPSCERAGKRLRDGDGIPADPKRALGFFERACVAGSSSACRSGLSLLKREAPDNHERESLLRKAACMNGKGDAAACASGAAELLGRQSKESRSLAATLATRGCELQSGPACAIAGDIATRAPVDRKKAAEHYARACNPGGGEGCAGLAMLCRKGVVSACERLDGEVRDEPLPADSFYAKAAMLRRKGDDVAAAQVLEDAIRESSSPRLQAELGLAYQGSGKFVGAERLLSEALATANDSWVEAHRSGLERVLTHAKSQLGWIVLACTSDGEEGHVVGATLGCDRAFRIVVGEHAVEVRAPNRLSAMVTATVVQGARAVVKADLEPHRCEKPGMIHMAGEDGGCCWPGQHWDSGSCAGEASPNAMAGISKTRSSSGGGLAPVSVRLLGGVTNFVSSSLFRSGVDAGADSTSFGARGELRLGLHLGGLLTLEGVIGGSRKSFSHWGDCDGGASDCARSFPFRDTIDFGAMLQIHTDPLRDGGNLDLHAGVGVRPWTRIEVDGAGGSAKLTSTVVPGELGASLYLGSSVSLDVLGLAELWLPWKYCDSECVGTEGVQTELAWAALGGLTLHID